MNEPNRPLWQIILAAAVLFGFFVLLTVIRTSKPIPPQNQPPTRAESPIAEEPAHTPAPTPTESTAETTTPEEPAETTAPEENGELFSKDYIGSGYKTIYNTYLKATSNTLEYGLTAKGDGYYIVNDTEDAVEILQYDRGVRQRQLRSVCIRALRKGRLRRLVSAGGPDFEHLRLSLLGRHRRRQRKNRLG